MKIIMCLSMAWLPQNLIVKLSLDETTERSLDRKIIKLVEMSTTQAINPFV